MREVRKVVLSVVVGAWYVWFVFVRVGVGWWVVWCGGWGGCPGDGD